MASSAPFPAYSWIALSSVLAVSYSSCLSFFLLCRHTTENSWSKGWLPYGASLHRLHRRLPWCVSSNLERCSQTTHQRNLGELPRSQQGGAHGNQALNGPIERKPPAGRNPFDCKSLQAKFCSHTTEDRLGLVYLTCIHVPLPKARNFCQDLLIEDYQNNFLGVNKHF